MNSILLSLNIIVQVLTCPVNDIDLVKKCMVNEGYVGYELFGPFDTDNGDQYLGYKSSLDDQVVITFPSEDFRYGGQ